MTDRTEVARVLGQIAAFLELKGENPFRVRAYQAAARAVAAFPRDLDEARKSGALAETKGIGPATLEIIEEVLDTGHSHVLEHLRDEIPPGLVEMLQISGIGVQKVRQIHEHLAIDSLPELEEAARDGRLAGLPRFGSKTAENILKGITSLRQTAEYRLFHHAQAEARELARVLGALEGVRRVEVVGSLRRHRELIRDLDFVIELGTRVEALYDRLGRAPGVSEFVRRHERAVTLRFTTGTVADIYVAAPEEFGFVMVRATGSDEHLAQLRERAGTVGLSWTETGLARGNEVVPARDEAAVYATLGLEWIPPELREAGGEVAAAAAHRLPELVTADDLLGFLHCHTNYSDGTSTVEDWAAAAGPAGYEYVGLTDHSQSAPYAGGLAPEDIDRQHAEIDAVNARYPGVRVLKGVEADILRDGSLDYTPAVRRRFDFVIASVHARFGLDRETMTERILTAMDDPTMAVLGHPTGRLLLSRDPFPMDLDRVFAKAAERGIAIEINADPQRLDLDWRAVRQATDAGVTISIGADAHGTSGMANMEIGIGIARKGWLTRDRLLNTLPLPEFLARVKRRRAD